MTPLFDFASPKGPASPSRSLAVERYDFSSVEWHGHRHTDQVIALYLKPVAVRHQPEFSGNSSELSLGPERVMICQRASTEHIFWDGPASFLCVRLKDETLKEAAQAHRGHARVDIRSPCMVADQRLIGLLCAVEAERACEYPAGRLFLDSIENALATTLVVGHSVAATAEQTATGGLAPYRFRRVVDFIATNLDKSIDLETLSGIAEMSVSHFAHQFKRTTNQSPYRYVTSMKIDQGRRMLEESDKSITEISLAVGFNSSQHFATIFRRFTGASPSQYRHRCR